MDADTMIIIASGPAYVLAYAVAGYVVLRLVSSATETKLTETIPSDQAVKK